MQVESNRFAKNIKNEEKHLKKQIDDIQKKKEDGSASAYILGQLILLEARHHKIKKIQKKIRLYLGGVVEVEAAVVEPPTVTTVDDDEGLDAGVEQDVNDEGEDLPPGADNDLFEEEDHEDKEEEENNDMDILE